MSHVPLLHREYRDLPRLPPPRRGPQICICTVAALAVLLGLMYYVAFLPDHVFPEAHNATLPPEAQRTRALATAMASGVQLHASELTAPILHDLIVAVGYLLDKKIESR